MGSKKILREETAYVVIVDFDGEMVYFQQKDILFWRENCRFRHCFVGTGVRPESRETPRSALVRKLGGTDDEAGEMPNAQETITHEMLFWETFRLKRTGDDQEYKCHMFVMFLNNRYKMMDLVDAIGSAGKKRATPTYISLERLKQIPSEDFMDSLHIVREEFFKEIKINPASFWEKLKRKNRRKF